MSVLLITLMCIGMPGYPILLIMRHTIHDEQGNRQPYESYLWEFHKLSCMPHHDSYYAMVRDDDIIMFVNMPMDANTIGGGAIKPKN